MATILLIRHAENDYVKTGRLAGRLPGVHLNEKGRMQAERIGNRLAGVKIKAIYCSPLERAVETAEPLSRQIGVKATLRGGLSEIDYGSWEGKTLKQLRRRKLWPAVQVRPSLVRIPGGETFAEAQIRICGELASLSQSHKENELIAVVSHADVIKLAVAYFIGLPLDLFQRLMVFPASITTLQLDGRGGRLINLNMADWETH
jgi:probable phosphomutase (TIGR03848 family)